MKRVTVGSRFAGLFAAFVAFGLIGAKDAGPSGPETAKKAAEDAARLALPVAKINGKPMTLGYVEGAVEKQSPLLRRDLADPVKRKEFLDKLVTTELLAAEAERRGYGKDKEVQEVAKNQLASLMHRQIADSVTEAAPDEVALRKYYDEHRTDYHKAEKVRARHILVSDKAKAEALLKDIVGRKASQHEFRRIAQESSEDQDTRLRGGDLTFFTRPAERQEGDPEVDPAVVEAAFKIKNNGDVYPAVVKGSKGYHILMRTGHRDKMDLTFEEAKERIFVLVAREQRKQKVEGAVDALKDRFKIQLFEENLKYVVIDLSIGPPEPEAQGGLTKSDQVKLRENIAKSAVPIRTPGDPDDLRAPAAQEKNE